MTGSGLFRRVRHIFWIVLLILTLSVGAVGQDDRGDINPYQSNLTSAIAPRDLPLATIGLYSSLNKKGGIWSYELGWNENHVSDQVHAYQVIIKRNENSVMEFKSTYTAESICDAVGKCRISLGVTQLNGNHTFKWKVRAINSVGRTNSNWRRFIVEYPGRVYIISPIGLYYTETLPTLFEWRPGRPATEYKFKLKIDDFRVYVSGWLDGSAFNCIARVCSLDMASIGFVPLMDVTYKWQVHTRNAAIRASVSKSRASIHIVAPGTTLTPTASMTFTPGFTSLPMHTPTLTPSPTATSTSTATVTPTYTMTPTATSTFIDTVTPTPSNTPIP